MSGSIDRTPTEAETDAPTVRPPSLSGASADARLHIAHGGHVGYLEGGKLVCSVTEPRVNPDGELEPHRVHTEVCSLKPHDIVVDVTDARQVQCSGGEHLHGPGCGHESVPHDGHVDWLVGDQLHHQDTASGACAVHGRVRLLAASEVRGASDGLGGSPALDGSASVISRSKFTAFTHTTCQDVARRGMRRRAAVAAARARAGHHMGHGHGTASAVAAAAAAAPAAGGAVLSVGSGSEPVPSTVAAAAAAKADDSEVTDTTPWYRERDAMRFVAMSFLTGGYFLVELIYGIAIGSLALQADAFHMASDLIALAVGFYSLLAAKREATHTATYGWTRMEVVGALMNGVFLLATCFNITLEAIHRMQDIDEVAGSLEGNGGLLTLVAVIGLLVNLLGLVIFGGGHGHSHGGGGGHGHSHGGGGGGHGHSHGGDVEDPAPAEHGHSHSHGHGHGHSHGEGEGEGDARSHTSDGGDADADKTEMNMNIRGVLLHVLGDALGSVGVIISGLVISFGEEWGQARYYTDPLVSLVIVAIIVTGTIPLVKRSVSMLLQHAPDNVDMVTLRAALLSVEGVVDLHELHVWELANSELIGSLHAIVSPNIDWMAASDELKAILHKHGVASTTIQPEYVGEGALVVCLGPCCNPSSAALTHAKSSGSRAKRSASSGGRGHSHSHGHGHSHGGGHDHSHGHGGHDAEAAAATSATGAGTA